ncbi:hypothetical protein C6Q04_15960 [Burkholderia multivorans]|nr:hypothetical protein C6Q04_15960 [Burkholderia multivorans]
MANARPAIVVGAASAVAAAVPDADTERRTPNAERRTPNAERRTPTIRTPADREPARAARPT